MAFYSGERRAKAALTPREREVMNLLTEGKANKVIAYRLGISIRTVEVHRSRVMSKLGVRNAVELVLLLHKQQMARYAPFAGLALAEPDHVDADGPAGAIAGTQWPGEPGA